MSERKQPKETVKVYPNKQTHIVVAGPEGPIFDRMTNPDEGKLQKIRQIQDEEHAIDTDVTWAENQRRSWHHAHR
jgi:hypothetical protein